MPAQDDSYTEAGVPTPHVAHDPDPAEGPPPQDDAAELRIFEGTGECRVLRLDRSATIGRCAGLEITLDDPEISRAHARITRREAAVYELEDLESTNGTYLNGGRIQRASLRFGDKIGIGRRIVLEFERFDQVAEAARRRHRFETVGRLGLGIAHDLNNLLAALVSGTSYLEDLPANKRLGDGEVQECVADLVLAAGRAADLAHSMLSLAKGRGNERTAVDVAALVREVVRLLRRVLDGGITVETALSEQVIVHGNWSELHQAVMNLCLNARDAMPKGGTLSIEATVDGKAGPPTVVLSVSDTGIGMDPATRARVFEPLFSTKQHKQSYGLGLSTVHEIVTRHGGRITVESEKNRGSKFTVCLPHFSATDRQTGTRESPPPAALRLLGKRVKMLLVDDEDVVRRSLARQLRSAGVQVTEASNGTETLAHYRPGAFDIVLLDIGVPGIGDLSTQAALFQSDPSVPLVLAMAGSTEEFRTKPGMPEAVDILHKPYRLEPIVDVVERLLAAQLQETTTQLRTR